MSSYLFFNIFSSLYVEIMRIFKFTTQNTFKKKKKKNSIFWFSNFLYKDDASFFPTIHIFSIIMANIKARIKINDISNSAWQGLLQKQINVYSFILLTFLLGHPVTLLSCAFERCVYNRVFQKMHILFVYDWIKIEKKRI